MCFYPTLIDNPKYRANKKNRGNPPPVQDWRVKKVPIGCGDCQECRKQKARGWQIRLLEDIKEHTNGKFITLTFSDESYKELHDELHKKSQVHLSGYDLDNAIATLGMRRFNERWRKKFKKALRHFTVTELGHNGTENIHIHGIVWTDESYEVIAERWGYGYIWPRPETRKKTWVNEQTVNYIIKYVTKQDTDHKGYKAVILTSPGIGKRYTSRVDAVRNKYKGIRTDETYRTRTGHKIALPIYWRNKIYTEVEREKLWLQKLDKQERWVGGERIDISNGEEQYWKILKWYQRRNTELGYGNGTRTWEQEQYERERRGLMQAERLKRASMPSATRGTSVPP